MSKTIDEERRQKGIGLMNNKQKIAIWAGIAAICLMGLFPPWVHVVSHPEFGRNTEPANYAPLFAPPLMSKYRWIGTEIDYSRLFIQWGIVVVIAGGLVVTFRR